MNIMNPEAHQQKMDRLTRKMGLLKRLMDREREALASLGISEDFEVGHEQQVLQRLERIAERTNALQPVKTSVEKILSEMERKLDEREATRADYNARVAADKVQDAAEAEAQKQFRIGDPVEWTDLGKRRTGKIARFGSHPLCGPFVEITPDERRFSFSDVRATILKDNVVKIEVGAA